MRPDPWPSVRSSAAAVLLATAPLLAPASAHGQPAAREVTFGGAAAVNGNAFPFVNYGFAPANRYQQLYAGVRFGGPVWIDALRFANTRSVAAGDPSGIVGGSYLVRLGVTGRGENALATDFDANAAGPMATFVGAAAAPGTLRLVGAPFRFDPRRGNLLLDVTVLSQARTGGLGLDFSTDEADGTSRVFNTIGLPGSPSVVRADAFGLITTFEVRNAVVPEPGALALTAAGLGALAGLRPALRRGARREA